MVCEVQTKWMVVWLARAIVWRYDILAAKDSASDRSDLEVTILGDLNKVIEARTPIRAITTSNSTKVYPDCLNMTTS